MINCKFFITRMDNTHNLKAYKNAFKSLKMDNDNYINIQIKPNTMMLQFEISCNSFNFYLDLLKSLLSIRANDEIWAVINTLFSFIDASSLDNTTMINGKRKVHFYGGTITITQEESNTDSSWIFNSIDVYSAVINKEDIYDISFLNDTNLSILKSSSEINQYLQSVYYDYDNVKFATSDIEGAFTLKELVYLAIMYNSGLLPLNKTIKTQRDNDIILIKLMPHNPTKTSDFIFTI